MPFTLDDLSRIRVRFGTGEKSRLEMSDTRFTAWLRNVGAEGTMTLMDAAPRRRGAGDQGQRVMSDE